MDKLIICETDRGRYAVRPMSWAGIWNEKGQIQESLNHLAMFIEKEDAEKFVEWKEAEEQGKLLKLLCAVGDRIYRIDTDEKIKNREIEIYDIDNIVILDGGTVLLKYDAYDGVICELENIVTDKPYLDFYKCFLSQEKAEAALKEL